MKAKLMLFVLLASFMISVNIVLADEIHDAVKNCDFEKVKDLAEKNPSVVNARDDRNCTPLHFAAENGYQGIAEFLLANGAEIDAREINSNTPLHYAATNGKTELAELFLANGADINAQNKDLFSALHLAAWNKHKAIIKLLVEKEATIDLKEYRGATPLMMTIWRMEDLDLVQLFIDHGADFNARIEGSWVSPIALAAQYGYREIVNFLLDKGAFVDEKSLVLTRFSVAQGLERLFKIIVEKGADLNVASNNGGTILHFAAEGGSPEIIEVLIEKGFNYDEPDRYGWTPLHYATQYGQKAAMEFLVNKGADINGQILSGKTPFNIATERGYDDIAQFLAATGAHQSSQQFPILKGAYLGQKPPGDKPEVFALGIVSSPDAEHGCLTFSPDGKTVYWTSEYKRSTSEGAFKAFSSFMENNRWTAPQFAFFTGDSLIDDDVPFVSPDGKKLFFMSKRSIKLGERTERNNYWVIEKTKKGWSEPKPISENVGRMTIRWRISVSNKGTLYFGATDAGGKGASDIYVSRFINGDYEKPENLGETINTEFSETAPFIASDESYIIFGREARRNKDVRDGLYIAFKNQAGSWGNSIYMGDEINAGGANNPYVSPDGKYLFFNSGRNRNFDIWWVDAKIIEELRSQEFEKL